MRIAVALAVSAAADHPIKGVITLIQGLHDKALQDGNDELASWNEFSAWCKTSIETLSGDIKSGEETLQVAQESKRSQEAKIDRLTKEIAKLDEEIAKHAENQGEEDDARSAENTEYQSRQQDLQDTVDAIDQAISDQGSFLQTGSLEVLEAVMTEEERKVTDSYKSGNGKKVDVVTTLKRLKKKFADKKKELEMAEKNSKLNYDKAKAARDDAEQAAGDSKTAKETSKGTTEGDLADTETTITDTETQLETDRGTLKTTKKDCNQRASEWQKRSQTRSDELKAMETAIKILKKTANVRASAGTAGEPEDFVQVFAHVSPKAQTKLQKAAALLKSTQLKYSAKDLEAVVEAVEGLQPYKGQHSKEAKGPFHKVVAQIKKMIFRLQDEQRKETEHKTWCDNEVTQTKAKEAEFLKRSNKSQVELDEITADIESSETKLGNAKDRIDEIRDEIKTLKEDRTADHKENMIDIKDADAAQKAIAQASSVLRAHYTKSGAISEEFIQRKGKELPDSPDLWDSPTYTGGDAKTSILEMLTSIGTDFSSMETQARASETTNQKAFDEELEALEVEKAEKEQEAKMMDERINRQTKAQKKKGAQLDNFEDQEHAAKVYHKELKPACYGDKEDYAAVKTAYEERQTARDAEIQALREAQEELEKEE
mmetsp:Transcript_15024/g.33040  ORF Transcript_15024/g.33040 Transcript_15024/m.33040 type:complete len:657 (+) Transcript_15024:68-2038(+)|eukprot:CAMPEP_0204335376 /NCGR_PEP_ID=MMETSP0469-20131031/18724_1 /ASSEMBLY_ACC=CAM_ASM_000384 /TAXON_ID=2969 /ORGANISM="Oxyrrhis marina" /LENGTH=656 /DNA_ID=CAMNT_0051319033 /DNA_START=46 /DNA_END=2016 /DNA_ORIENTATION=+